MTRKQRTAQKRCTVQVISCLTALTLTIGACGLSTSAKPALAADRTLETNTNGAEIVPLRAERTSPEARALAKKILDAMGGYKNFRQFNDLPCRARGKIVQTSSISSVVNSFDCDILVKREQQRITINFLGQPLTTVYDGKNCWTEQGDSILPSDKETARRIEEDIQHGFLLLESVDNPETILQVGADKTIEGRDCEALVVWAKDGLPTTFYADKVSHLVLASSYPGVDLEQGLKLEKSYHYFDYKPIAHTMQPYKVVEYSGSKKVSETLIDSVTADEKITDATFAMPKEVVPARLLMGPVTIPFEYVGNEIIIHTTVHGAGNNTEGRDLKFIVDTGATQSILDRGAARGLGTLTASNLAMTTGAGSIKTEALTIEKLALGEMILNKVPFATADLSAFGGEAKSRPAGLIGANILKRFLVTIDYENQKLIFADPTKVIVPEGATAVNTMPSLGMAGMAVEGKLDGKEKVTFLIDTGAAFNNISETKVKPLLTGPIYQAGMLKGLDGKKVKTAAARFNTLNLDGLRIDNPVFSVAPPNAVGQVDSGIINSKDLAILGNPILSHYTVTFDYRGQRLIFSQSRNQKARAEYDKKLQEIKLAWLKTNDASAAVVALNKLADNAREDSLSAIEAMVRCELALALCQRDGGRFTPDKLFAPIQPEDLVADSGEAAIKSNKPPASEKMFAEAEGQLLTAFTLAQKSADRIAEGRVLAAWGLMYASQDKDIVYLASAKQKLGKAVALAPTNADVLAASGYFLSRLESVKPPTVNSLPVKAAVARSKAATAMAGSASKHPGAKVGSAPLEKVSADKTVLTFKTPQDVGKWLVDQIIDQAIMTDPGNWLALWTKYERLRTLNNAAEMKIIAGQIKHYYPDIDIENYLK